MGILIQVQQCGHQETVSETFYDIFNEFFIHFIQRVPFVVIKPLGNIMALLHVMDAKVSFDDQFVENTLIHADSVEHVKLTKVLISSSESHYII